MWWNGEGVLEQGGEARTNNTADHDENDDFNDFNNWGGKVGIYEPNRFR